MSDENTAHNPVLNKRAALDEALANIKREMAPVTKDGENPHFKSTFATLNAHLKAVEPLLEKHGCVLTQPVVYDARTGSNVQVTKIKHTASGESEESSLNLGEQKDMQKLGSAITYARRYTLGCLLAMQAIDDDAEGTMSRKKTKTVASKGDF